MEKAKRKRRRRRIDSNSGYIASDATRKKPRVDQGPEDQRKEEGERGREKIPVKSNQGKV